MFALSQSFTFRASFSLAFLCSVAGLGFWGFAYNVAHGHYGTGAAAGVGVGLFCYLIYQLILSWAKYRRETYEGADVHRWRVRRRRPPTRLGVVLNACGACSSG